MTVHSETVHALGGGDELARTAEQLNLRTVFVYGSRARGDYQADSDYEIGIVTTEGTPPRSAALFSECLPPHLTSRVYAFKNADVASGNLDVPFTRRLFVAELKQSAVTVYGSDIRTDLPDFPIRWVDLIEEHAFLRARVLDGLICARDGHAVTAADLCWKAACLSARLYLLASESVFVTRRDVLLQYPWAHELHGLRDWMNREHVEGRIREDATSVRELSAMVTRTIYDAVCEAEPFLPSWVRRR